MLRLAVSLFLKFFIFFLYNRYFGNPGPETLSVDPSINADITESLNILKWVTSPQDRSHPPRTGHIPPGPVTSPRTGPRNYPMGREPERK